ncbi:HNH endonuclease signature motif containing protein [Streptomyces sp. H34-S4]|uniref:HNH endonuclease signature motif containing protein n=1 Tax=Streptomyces sp. H34-S4 TaxID=2996463 RepID=UPI002271659A|nr:HNH endonuclease [Streptomyces sp. H34-S4]MCY0939695.1 HNH endonuclease [Streptomyces sp. H34-S4]
MAVSPYTREQLAGAAAAAARTLTETLEKLGVDPRSGSRRYLHDRMRRLGVDVSHFEREGTKWTKKILQEAVSEATNMCDVLRRLGLDNVGGHHTHISRKVKAMGIDTSHFTSSSGAGRYHARRTPESLLVKQAPERAGRVPGERLKRAMTALGVEERCAECGIEAVWMGEPLSLEVDHVNGDWQDNRPENLRLLCPNCHSTTDTYRGRGKGRQ